MKKEICVLFLALILCQPSLLLGENSNDQDKPPKVALVLSGGGAKGSAHIGVLKYLEEIGMPIDIVVGTSMGAIIGGLYSMGYTANELDSLISAQDWNIVMSNRPLRSELSYTQRVESETFMLSIPFKLFKNLYKNSENEIEEHAMERSLAAAFPSGFISGQNVFNLLNGLSVGYQDSTDFNNLPIPFACVAYDLASGNEVVWRNGVLPLAIRSSMAIPGVFSPVRIDGKVLIDGGVINNYAVDVAKEMGADIVIGVIVSADVDTNPDNLASLPDILNQLISLMGREKHKQNVLETDVLITPDISGFSTMSFDEASVDSLIVNGYLAAKDQNEELLNIKKEMDGYGKKRQYSEAPFALDILSDSLKISSVEISGIDQKYAFKLLKKTNLLSGNYVSGKEIEALIATLYGTKAFSQVTYMLKGDKEPYHLVINCIEASPHKFSLGFRYDSEESAAILLSLGLNSQKLTGHKLDIMGRLSFNSYGKLNWGYAFSGFPQLNLSYMIKSTDMNIFDKGEVQTNLKYIYNSVEASFSGMNLKRFDLRLGAKLEDFNFKHILSSTDINFNRDSTSRTFLSGFANVAMDTRDKFNFPTRGHRANAEFNAYLLGFRQGYKPFLSLQAGYGVVIPVSKRVKITPSVSGRFLFGDVIPIGYMNVLGGSEPGRYMNQQMPFVGIKHADTFEKNVVVLRVDARVRMWEKHYIYARLNYLNESNVLSDILYVHNGYWGGGLKYAYDSIIGPLSFDIYWSDKTRRVGAYINVGYYF